MRFKLLCLLCLVFVCQVLHADTSFADSLFAHKEYYRAITEYYRGLFSEDNPEYCHAQIRACYLAGEDFEGLIDYLQNPRSTQDHIFLSLAHLKNRRPDLAAIINDTNNHQTQMLLWAYSNCYLGRFKEAEQRLNRISDPLYKEQADQVKTINSEAQNLGYRSPYLAGVLGVVPGLGYAYGGRWQTAISAFVTNALLFAVIYELGDRELYISSAAMTAAGLGFYIGSIYGSVSSAAKQNQAIRNDYLDKYTDKLFKELLEKR